MFSNGKEKRLESVFLERVQVDSRIKYREKECSTISLVNFWRKDLDSIKVEFTKKPNGVMLQERTRHAVSHYILN